MLTYKAWTNPSQHILEVEIDVNLLVLGLGIAKMAIPIAMFFYGNLLN